MVQRAYFDVPTLFLIDIHTNKSMKDSDSNGTKHDTFKFICRIKNVAYTYENEWP